MLPATASAASRQRCSTGLQSFRMREYVCVGTPEEIDAFSPPLDEAAETFATQLGLSWRIDHASDPFFGRGGKLMAMSQVEQALKFELLIPVHSAEEPTACMSFNYHCGSFWRDLEHLHRVRRSRAYRLRRLRHRSPRFGAVRYARRRVRAMADARAPGAVGLNSGSTISRRFPGPGSIASAIIASRATSAVANVRCRRARSGSMPVNSRIASTAWCRTCRRRSSRGSPSRPRLE